MLPKQGDLKVCPSLHKSELPYQGLDFNTLKVCNGTTLEYCAASKGGMSVLSMYLSVLFSNGIVFWEI